MIRGRGGRGGPHPSPPPQVKLSPRKNAPANRPFPPLRPSSYSSSLAGEALPALPTDPPSCPSRLFQVKLSPRKDAPPITALVDYTGFCGQAAAEEAVAIARAAETFSRISPTDARARMVAERCALYDHAVCVSCICVYACNFCMYVC